MNVFCNINSFCRKTQWASLLILYLFSLSDRHTHTHTLFSLCLCSSFLLSLPASLCACVLSFPSHGAPVFSKQDRPPLNTPPLRSLAARQGQHDRIFPLLPSFSHPLSPSVSLTRLS